MSISPDQLHVIRCYDRLPPLAGGMERHIAELTAAQRRQGVRVTEIYNGGVPTGESVQVCPNLHTYLLRPNVLRWAVFYSAMLLCRLNFSDGRIPIMHVHGDWHSFIGGRLAARRFKIGTLAASLHEWARAPDSLYRFALGGYAPIFTTGVRDAERLRRVLGKEPLHLVSAAADIFFQRRSENSTPVDVIAAGTVNARKNYELLVECAVKLPQFSFAIYGDGPERPRLEALADRMGATNVRFAGAVDRAEIRRSMGTARLLVNTSLAEGSPTVALEAMACGLPVVMTPSNDYRFLIDAGVNGIVTYGWSADELADAIRHFLEHPERLARSAKAAREAAAPHRWEQKARIVTEAMIAAVRASKTISE